MGFYSDMIDFSEQNAASEKIFGVVTGTVKENWDKEHPGMIKAEYFLGEKGKNVTGWIPVAVPYGGNQYGGYALPEIKDTVVIAFIGGDRNCPVVIGSLWSKVNALPPDAANEKNTIKKFVTKGGCQVTFDDTDKKNKIEISTPKKMHITIEDEPEKITVGDDKGDNSIVFDCKGGKVTVNGGKTLELKVGGSAMAVFDGNAKSIKLDANKIDIDAKQALNAKSSNTQLSGSMMAIKGDSTTKIESSGMMQIKGAMVKIN